MIPTTYWGFSFTFWKSWSRTAFLFTKLFIKSRLKRIWYRSITEFSWNLLCVSICRQGVPGYGFITSNISWLWIVIIWLARRLYVSWTDKIAIAVEWWSRLSRILKVNAFLVDGFSSDSCKIDWSRLTSPKSPGYLSIPRFSKTRFICSFMD